MYTQLVIYGNGCLVLDQETETLIYIPIVYSIHLHVSVLSFSIKCENLCEKRKLKRLILYEQNKNFNKHEKKEG